MLVQPGQSGEGTNAESDSAGRRSYGRSGLALREFRSILQPTRSIIARGAPFGSHFRHMRALCRSFTRLPCLCSAGALTPSRPATAAKLTEPMPASLARSAPAATTSDVFSPTLGNGASRGQRKERVCNLLRIPSSGVVVAVLDHLVPTRIGCGCGPMFGRLLNARGHRITCKARSAVASPPKRR